MRKNTVRARMISVLTACAGVCTAEASLFTVGIVTDTRISDDLKSCGLCRKAFEMSQSAGADLIVNVGDIADSHSPKGYLNYGLQVHGSDVNGKIRFEYVRMDRRPPSGGISMSSTEHGSMPQLKGRDMQ